MQHFFFYISYFCHLHSLFSVTPCPHATAFYCWFNQCFIQYQKWYSIISILTRLLTVWPKNRGSIPGRSKIRVQRQLHLLYHLCLWIPETFKFRCQFYSCGLICRLNINFSRWVHTCSEDMHWNQLESSPSAHCVPDFWWRWRWAAELQGIHCNYERQAPQRI